MAELKQFKLLFDQTVQDEVNLNLEKMVKLVSEKYQIDKTEIFNLLQNFHQSIEPTTQDQSNEASRVDLVVNTAKCLGKTKFGTQCSRSRLGTSEFCGSHASKLPYGRVDEEIDDKQAKKRGRPRKD